MAESFPHVDLVLGPVGDGVTDPLFGILTDNDRHIPAVIKHIENPVGEIALVNEYVSYKLARAFKLPIPKGGCAVIDEQTEDPEDFVVFAKGSCFYSHRLDHVTNSSASFLGIVENKQDFERIMLFDHIINNIDRRRNNLLADYSSSSGPRLSIIDHTHVFAGGPHWSRKSLEAGIEANDYMLTDISAQQSYDDFFLQKTINRETLLSASQSMVGIITRPLLEDILAGLPADWHLAKGDAVALMEYLLYRANHLVEYVDIIVRERELD